MREEGKLVRQTQRSHTQKLDKYYPIYIYEYDTAPFFATSSFDKTKSGTTCISLQKPALREKLQKETVE